MPNLINTDNAGNVFYNYITPVVKGDQSLMPTSFLVNKYGATINGSGDALVRFPAPGIETRTVGNRVEIRNGAFNVYAALKGTGADSDSYNVFTDFNNTGFVTTTTGRAFVVANDYSIAHAIFDITNNTLRFFYYIGWLREPVYTGNVYPLGLAYVKSSGVSQRISTVNSTGMVNLSTAADAITSPPIVCTAGTDPGDGSETFTDVVIRDAAAPNNPVGKLWNCIDMPATCNVGELWRNTGAHDGDASASEQDTYLCIMPWGTRKLGMRVWTENVV